MPFIILIIVLKVCCIFSFKRSDERLRDIIRQQEEESKRLNDQYVLKKYHAMNQEEIELKKIDKLRDYQKRIDR